MLLQPIIPPALIATIMFRTPKIRTDAMHAPIVSFELFPPFSGAVVAAIFGTNVPRICILEVSLLVL